MTDFATPRWRRSSRSDSRQYERTRDGPRETVVGVDSIETFDYQERESVHVID
ncbi:hypothetical protein LC1Hm_4016 (plasmid) [Halomicrobium sp. LC1Hm]|nr:hypothetical protein LC1Hm_4016 [Halomicrobium sp. LC1Hm]